MPLLANYCKKNKSRCREDIESDQNCHCEDSKTGSELAVSFESKCSDDEGEPQSAYNKVGFVKTLLGPSLEDAVLKTLEFGKSLVQGSNESDSECIEDSKKIIPKKPCKERCKSRAEKCFKQGLKSHVCGAKKNADCGLDRKRLVFTARVEDSMPLVRKPPRKLSQLSKIRSLDSDLKTAPQSPEKIKKQLEALIQINKSEPPEHDWNIVSNIPAVPVEMTVMPSMCVYKTPVHANSSPCEGQSPRRCNDEGSVSRCRQLRNRLGAMSGICHTSEFITNALGPTLDVSIIENLKMMRDIFKNEDGRGEGGQACTGDSKRSSCVSFVGSGSMKPGSCSRRSSTSRSCSKGSSSEESAACRIKEAEGKIQELLEKQCSLQKRIEQEETEWSCKRIAFEEEERRMCEMRRKAPQKHMLDCSTQKSQVDVSEGRYDSLRQRVACEEEKLSRLKDQYECYRRELCIAKSRRNAMKRNKCILDAWDVIASRVCHTRLPSFSRSYALERKELNASDSSGTLHCCFPVPLNGNEESGENMSVGSKRCKSQTHCGADFGLQGSRSNENVCAECTLTAKTCLMAQGEIPFPVQRDVTCGLHQVLKSCRCKPSGKGEPVSCTSDDELMKKSARAKQPRCKSPCRSKSDTRMGRGKNPSKIVKVLWAVTRINIFQDNCRTYEVMDATPTPPTCTPIKTEGIFVVRNSQKTGCHESRARKKCTINFSKK